MKINAVTMPGTIIEFGAVVASGDVVKGIVRSAL
jgi:acetyltransferase-like isoleucine patch superfamily enzyme